MAHSICIKLALTPTWLAVDELDVVDGQERAFDALPAPLDVDGDGEGVHVAAVASLVSNPSAAG